MANLAYWVRTSRVGEGIATEAVILVARYGFEKLGFQRIEIIVSKDNAPSLRVAEKLGAVREGLLRNRLLLHGTPCDAYMHSLIQKEFGLINTAEPSLQPTPWTGRFSSEGPSMGILNNKPRNERGR